MASPEAPTGPRASAPTTPPYRQAEATIEISAPRWLRPGSSLIRCRPGILIEVVRHRGGGLTKGQARFHARLDGEIQTVTMRYLRHPWLQFSQQRRRLGKSGDLAPPGPSIAPDLENYQPLPASTAKDVKMALMMPRSARLRHPLLRLVLLAFTNIQVVIQIIYWHLFSCSLWHFRGYHWR
jgi:hypothetical protein